MSDHDRRSLLRLLDAMHAHFDRRISGQELLHLAAAARDSLNPSAPHDPGLAASVRASGLLSGAKGNPVPTEPHGNLRSALAELEEPL